MFPLAVLGLGTGEWILLVVVILVIFGVGKLPQIGSGLGKGLRNFRRSVKGEDEEEPKAPPEDPMPRH